MNITFLGAAHEVTGSCTLVETGNTKFLVDCGMEQEMDIYENRDLPVLPANIDFVLLTHAHIDHSGKLPLLCAAGFRGKIYTTAATTKLCKIMLIDSAHIQEMEAEWKNRKSKRSGGIEYTPMYTTQDAEKCMEYFYSCRYNSTIAINDDISVRFIDAGHLLGSASIEITINECGEQKVLLFSGDVGNVNRPLIRDPQKPERADYVVIESTYGNRLHGVRNDYVMQLTDVIARTFSRGGNVVIPSFAVGRTQELLYLIREIKERGLLSQFGDFPVWVDSPLAVEATGIYGEDMYEYCDEETIDLLKRGIDPIKFPNLRLSVTTEESVAINADPMPKVILSASGMCEAGRIRHHLKHNLWRAESTILFVGYQAEGTLGRILVDGARTVKLFGEEIAVNAEIASMDGISGHADMDMLLDWLSSIKTRPEMIFVNHGNDHVCDDFAQTIVRRLQIPACAPYSGAKYDLLDFKCLEFGNTVKLKQRPNKRAKAVFDRLVAAGKRLLDVIDQNRGCANKDLAKFADQINELCNKWERK
ncbi:MAG: MBL fold metallo-hydrolase [Clostridia bacterium]|nr:MBL fold metallo-hydrolase [Clostridia bacterium]